MKRLIVCAFAVLAASAANAAQATGHSELVIYPDDTGDMVSISLISYGDTIVGETSFGDGTINLTREDGGWTGWVNGQHYDFTCDQSACSGLTAQGGSNIGLQHETTGGVATEKLSGTLNFGFINASYSPNEITVSADGSLNLTSNGDSTWDGNGIFPSVGGEVNTFTAHLDGDGDLAAITDPALFVLYLVAPFVRAHQ